MYRLKSAFGGKLKNRKIHNQKIEAALRHNQENLIAQQAAKRALHAQVDNLTYMLMTSLAWTLKAWFFSEFSGKRINPNTLTGKYKLVTSEGLVKNQVAVLTFYQVRIFIS